MPPRKNSRYQFCLAVRRTGKLFLSTPVPFRFEEHADTVIHYTTEGQTIDQIAEYYYGDNGWRYWWAIAQFQPNPIVDPTLSFQANTEILIPSKRVLTQIIQNPDRRKQF